MLPLDNQGSWACVDPAEAGVVLDFLSKVNGNLLAILNTHHHSDHVGANRALKEKTNCSVYGSKSDSKRIPCIDRLLEDGEEFELSSERFQVFDVSAHTQGHIAYFMPEKKNIFVGDTLFAMGCGRLFEGTAEQMVQAHKKLLALPSDTLVYCAHEYTLSNGEFALTLEKGNEKLLKRIQEVKLKREKGIPTIPFSIQEELETNPFLRLNSPEILQSIDMKSSDGDFSIFAKIRALKDHF
jgi:hydroxyacylglutathione hydrolase